GRQPAGTRRRGPCARPGWPSDRRPPGPRDGDRVPSGADGGPAPPSAPARADDPMKDGSIRPARLTDRQALVALSRQVHEGNEGFRRSLGVPARSAAPPQISLAALMPSWLPLRSPSVHLVAEWDGRLVG